MNHSIRLRVHRLESPVEEINFEAKRVFNAGWAAKDQRELQRHIKELAALGVQPPKHVPTLFSISNHLLSTSRVVQVQGPSTSGEVEYVLLWHNGSIFVTVGSDHTDRSLEAFSIPRSKNACPNIIAHDAWLFEEVLPHWSSIELRSTVRVGDRAFKYQDGRCGDLLPPEYWIDDLVSRAGGTDAGLVFFSGTIATRGGLAYGDFFEFCMKDPVLERHIRHEYRCQVLTGAIED